MFAKSILEKSIKYIAFRDGKGNFKPKLINRRQNMS